MRNKAKIILTLLSTTISNGSLAFQVAPDRFHTFTLRPTNSHLCVGQSMPYFCDDNTSNAKEDNGANQAQSIILAGTSPKVIRLRKQLQEILSSPKKSPVLIVGPQGSERTDIAEELLNRLPSTQKKTIHRLSMDDAADHIDTMLGMEGQPGLLDLLAPQSNTIILLKSFESRTVENADALDRRNDLFQEVATIFANQTFYSRHEGKTKAFAPRIIATCSCQPEFLDDVSDFFLVKVPALGSRTQDMEAIATAEVKVLEKMYGLENVQLSTEAVHRLRDHRWEVCADELEVDLRNALDLLATEKRQNPMLPNVLLSKHMLVNSFNERMRRRLLYDFPVLRRIIMSPWIFDHTLRYIVTPAFVLTLALLILGPQTREHNTALTYFWAGWWPAVMLSFPFLGRIWCSICPFMAVGTLAQETVTSFGVELKKWPQWGKEIGSAFAFGLFAAILMWEELWNLPDNGTLSAYLLLLITSGAVFNSVQFENRMWCRYLCPIGAMCRVFGTISMTEVRSWKANCEGCTDPQCVKGMSPAVSPSDKFAIKGCTMELKNNQLRDMGDCTLCMSCVKNCEREVPEFNIRPIGLDYGLPWLLPPALQSPESMSLSQVETNFWLGALVTTLQGSIFVHYMPQILSQVGLDPAVATATPALDMPFLVHSVITAVLLALPGLVSLGADKVSAPTQSAIALLMSQWEKRLDSKERRVIIAMYDTMMKSDKPIQETLREFDPDGDGKITCWECKQALSHLDIPEDQCETLMGIMKRRFGDTTSLEIETWFDTLQELNLNARLADLDPSQKKQEPRLQHLGNQLQSKKTFVEIFNDLDKNNDGYITEEEFNELLKQKKLKNPLTEQEAHKVFSDADSVNVGYLNLFEFMNMMRKIVRVGIQEIGYGYLPLAWASLTAYWLGFGMEELGLVLTRLPDTFFMETSMTLPQLSATTEVTKLVQAILVAVALPISIGLTQKLCNDNKIDQVRFGLHAAIQVVMAAETLYLMIFASPVLMA